VSEKKVLWRRRWLNRPRNHTVAFILLTLERYTNIAKDGTADIEVTGDVTIHDCNRQIRLDFSTDANSRYKIRRLIEELEHFEKVLLYEIELMEAVDNG